MTRSALRILRSGARYVVGIHIANGDATYFDELADGVPGDWGVASISSRYLPLEMVPGSLPDLATRYSSLLADALSGAPVVLGGLGFGGLTALACALIDQPETRVLGLFALATKIPEPDWVKRPSDLDTLARVLVEHRARWAELDPPATHATSGDAVERLRRGLAAIGIPVDADEASHELQLFQKHVRAMLTFRAQPIDVPCMLFTARDADNDNGWDAIAPHAIRRSLPGNHYSIARPQNRDAFGAGLVELLRHV